MQRLNKLLQQLNIVEAPDEEEEGGSSGGAGVYRTKIEDID